MSHFRFLTRFLAVAVFLSALGVSCSWFGPPPPVARHGQLSIRDRTLVDSHGVPVQLRGFSSQTLSSGDIFFSPRYLAELRDKFDCDVVRAAMYDDDPFAMGYLTNPGLKKTMETVVKDATKAGLYVIIDWHILRDNDPLFHLKEAKVFFAAIAQEFHQYNNVFYEICNEPNGDNVTWEGNIRPYAEQVLSVIRAYDKHNIVIVGTPHWSQDVDQAALDPLPDPRVMYTMHFYAGTHKQELRDKTLQALQTIPIFCTEMGATDASGNGSVYPQELKTWMDFLDAHNLSWCNWNLSSFTEGSAALQATFSPEVDNLADRLTASGTLIKAYMTRGRSK